MAVALAVWTATARTALVESWPLKGSSRPAHSPPMYGGSSYAEATRRDGGLALAELQPVADAAVHGAIGILNSFVIRLSNCDTVPPAGLYPYQPMFSLLPRPLLQNIAQFQPSM